MVWLGTLVVMLVLLVAVDSRRGTYRPKKDSSGRRRAILNGEYIDFDEQERTNSYVED